MSPTASHGFEQIHSYGLRVSSPTGNVIGMEDAMDAAWQFVEPAIIDQHKEHGLCGVWTKAFRCGWEAATRAHAATSADPLRAAVEGIADDYITSNTHRPGWVLIPEAKFHAIRAALATTTEGSADDQRMSDEYGCGAGGLTPADVASSLEARSGE